MFEARSKAETDTANLGYSLDDVIACLTSLQEDDFNDCSTVTLSASGGRSMRSYADSYVTEFKGPTEEVDKLYVKFRVSATWLFVHSFHLSTK
ncbi:hypothetical protein [Candidatus Rariloculus sp.]|uniref:hypothetical protein n=1 Tax=Candidatus Rariloculus sp. TaxID=3101265 RepID=UPI003D0C26AF